MKKIGFKPVFHNAIKKGFKTMTTRTRKYGEPGDRLVSDGMIIKLIEVRQMSLEHVARDHWKEEGVVDAYAFARIWKEIHGEFDPRRIVWLHRFEYVGQDG